MKKQFSCFVLLLLAISFLMTACAEQEMLGEDPVKARNATASSMYNVNTLQDIPNQTPIDTVVVATAKTPGECEWYREGEILQNVGPVASVDLRTYGALMDYEVEEVVKGDTALVGTTITVCEKIRLVDGSLSTPFCIGENADRVVLCLRKSSDGTLYYCHIAEYFLMPVLDDGTLEVWPYINRSREKITLADFKALYE